MSTDVRNPLKESLSHFETCLQTPVVPGELLRWATNAQESCRQVRAELEAAVSQEHPGLYKQMFREDTDLASKIAALKQEDDQLITNLGPVETSIGRLRQAAEMVEPNEARLEDRVQAVADEGLLYILSVRKHETAINTWYVEALERDNGVGD